MIMTPGDTIATDAAPLQEVFSSFQGEGPYVGERQLFVRVAHCHLKCTYCDTPMTQPDGRLHVQPISNFTPAQVLENPVTPDALMAVLRPMLMALPHHSVSLTGGEPLLYHRFLKQLLPQLQPLTRTYLETSGTQPNFLAEVLEWTDIIAMDFKLPSATREPPQYEAHREFLAVARTRPATELFVKVIFDTRTPEAEWAALESVISDRDLPIILQPVTDLDDQRVHVPASVIEQVAIRVSRTFRHVRVIPQTHKMLNVP